MNSMNRAYDLTSVPLLSRRTFLQAPVQGAAATALLSTLEGASPDVRLERDGDDLRFVSGKTPICRILATALGEPVGAASPVKFGQVAAGRAQRTLQFAGWEVSEQLNRISSDLFEWRRSWTNTANATADADFRMEAETAYSPEFTLIPAISYDGNPEYGRNAPKGLGADGVPWQFSAYRSSLPAGNYSEGGGWSVFVFVSTRRPSLDCGFSLVEGQGRLVHRLMWPERDNLRSRMSSGFRETLRIEPGQSFETVAYVVIRPASEKRRAWRGGLDHAWRQNRHVVKAWFPPKQLWALGAQFGRETLWYDGSDYTGFVLGVNYTNGKWVPEPSIRFEIGWCGQGAAWGTLLLQDYIWNKNPDSLAKAEKALDFYAENGRLPCGLIYTHYNMKLGARRWSVHNQTYLGRPAKPGEKYVDTCNLGHAGYQYLVASELAEKCGMHKPLWRQIGMDMCNFFVDHVLPDGTFGKAWSLEGECLAPGNTTGAHILWPMLKAYRMTKDRRYLDAARRAHKVYMERDMDKVICTSGAIDADTIDKEAGLPLLFAALDLYEITGEKTYLRDAELAGYYLATWQWHYTVPFDPKSPALEIRYDTFAGTSITVMAQGQDPWGELIALGWLRLGAALKQDIWRDRAVQCFNQGTIGMSDGNLVLKGAKRPAGGQNEGFMMRLRTEDGRRLVGDYNTWLVSWPNAFRMVTLMHWPRWQDFETR